MKSNLTNNRESNAIKESRFGTVRLFVILAFLTLGYGQAFGQQVLKVNPESILIIPNRSSENESVNAATAKMELVIWFMGSKQNAPVSSDQNNSTKVGKKSFINSGMKPNRTLIKSFLKKAVNYDTTLV